MIIADQRAGEPDILNQVAFKDLVIRDLDGVELSRIPNSTHRWTAEQLEDVDNDIRALIGDVADNGYELFLGNMFVGGSEI